MPVRVECIKEASTTVAQIRVPLMIDDVQYSYDKEAEKNVDAKDLSNMKSVSISALSVFQYVEFSHRKDQSNKSIRNDKISK
jgi:hypothetical protein